MARERVSADSFHLDTMVAFVKEAVLLIEAGTSFVIFTSLWNMRKKTEAENDSRCNGSLFVAKVCRNAQSLQWSLS